MARVLIIDGFAGGLVNFRGSLLTRLGAMGHDVIAAAPAIAGDVSNALSRSGVRSCNLAMRRGGTNPLTDLKALIKLYRLVKEVSPDVVMLYSVKPVVYGLLAATLSRVSVRCAVITGLGYGFAGNSLRGALVGVVQCALYRMSLRLSNYILFQNADDLAECRRLRLIADGASVTVIAGSGVDTEYFARKELPAELSFVMVGRLIRAKGVREYCRAVGKVRRRYPTVKCRLVGWWDQDSPDRFSRRELERLLVENGVEYVGHVRDVRSELSRCSVFVLPSYREGMPRSVLEALSVGRPIITTNAPGCRETVIEGVNGFRVPVKDEEALANAMLRCCESPDILTRFGNESRKLAETKYDERIVNGEIIRLLGLAKPLES